LFFLKLNPAFRDYVYWSQKEAAFQLPRVDPSFEGDRLDCRCECSNVHCVVESGRQSQTSFLFTTRVLTLSEVFDSIRFTRKDQGERNGSWLERESGIGGGSQSGNGASHRLRFCARGRESKHLRARRGHAQR